MTFCVGLRVDDGLVALADTQIVRGGEVSSQGAAAPPDPEVGHANGQGNANGRITRNGSSNGVANGNVRGAEADPPGLATGKSLGGPRQAAHDTGGRPRLRRHRRLSRRTTGALSADRRLLRDGPSRRGETAMS